MAEISSEWNTFDDYNGVRVPRPNRTTQNSEFDPFTGFFSHMNEDQIDPNFKQYSYETSTKGIQKRKIEPIRLNQESADLQAQTNFELI